LTDAALSPKAIHHVAVVVAPLDDAIEFYRSVLGATPRSDRPDVEVKGAWFDVGTQQVHLVEGELSGGERDRLSTLAVRCKPHFTLAVEDLDAAIAVLRLRGVEVSEAVEIGMGFQAFLYDPSGNLIEILQPGA
jgi:glyoxylase I family protein